MNTATTYSAHGKFLLTGEYAVLAGVKGLAVPLKLNQYLEVIARADSNINWVSKDVDGSAWYEASFDKSLNGSVDTNAISIKLKELLSTALQLSGKSGFEHGYDVVTTLDFDRSFGMGTSSTLVAMLAQWIGCDAFALQFACFGGSGYDIACATARQAIVYKYDAARPVVELVTFEPSFSKDLHFVYLNRKQNSRDSIARFNKEKLTTQVSERLNAMPQLFLDAAHSLRDFQQLMREHEELISNLIGLKPVQQIHFTDFNGAIKSLGGWGGDFILAAGANAPEYFKARGYDVVLGWDEVVL